MAGIFGDKSQQLHSRMIRGEGLAYMPLETVGPVVDKLLPIMDEVKQTCPFFLSGRATECTPGDQQATHHAASKNDGGSYSASALEYSSCSK